MVRHGRIGAETHYQVEGRPFGAHGLHHVLQSAVDGELGAAGLDMRLHQAESFRGYAAGPAQRLDLGAFLDRPERPGKAALLLQAGLAPRGAAGIGFRFRLEGGMLQLELFYAGQGRGFRGAVGGDGLGESYFGTELLHEHLGHENPGAGAGNEHGAVVQVKTGEEAYFQGAAHQHGVQLVLFEHVLQVFYTFSVNIHGLIAPHKTGIPAS